MDSFNPTTEEKELLTRLRHGDESAFSCIYNLHWKKCFVMAAHRLQNLAEAEEVVQDIFLDLWKRREHLQVSNSLASYLFAGVKYKVINIFAKRHLQIQYREHASVAQPVTDQSTEQNLHAHELRQQLQQETAKLPEKCRMVFLLSREQGYSQKQIAQELNISEKTVEAHLSKALRNLRTGLSHLMTFF